jgi:hypothetical protein
VLSSTFLDSQTMYDRALPWSASNPAKRRKVQIKKPTSSPGRASMLASDPQARTVVKTQDHLDKVSTKVCAGNATNPAKRSKGADEQSTVAMADAGMGRSRGGHGLAHRPTSTDGCENPGPPRQGVY